MAQRGVSIRHRVIRLAASWRGSHRGRPCAETSELRSRHSYLAPASDYKLEIQILKLTVNEEISADRFELAQPAGAELVRVGEERRERSRDLATDCEQCDAPPNSDGCERDRGCVEVALVILIVGLTSGLLQETAKRIEGIGAILCCSPPRRRISGIQRRAHADQDR